MAVANQKGGVGKSTTAVSLGAALAEAGHRVLVIDLDPQGNASTGLGIRHESRDVTVYDVLAANADIRGAIVDTPVPNLFAVPSTIDLAGAEIELVSQFSREMRLRRALDPIRSGAHDFILLDCPPSLGLLTINALAAAEELIVPIQCEYYALEGLGQLLRNVRLVQQNVNPGLRLSGIVMTMFDPRTKLSEQVVDEVRKFFGELVYATVIPRTVRLSEAPGFGQPITLYDPRSRGAECYRDLAAEVASRPPQEGPLPTFEEIPNVSVVIEPVVPPPTPVSSAPRPLREAAAASDDDSSADEDWEEEGDFEAGGDRTWEGDFEAGRAATEEAEAAPGGIPNHAPAHAEGPEIVREPDGGTEAEPHSNFGVAEERPSASKDVNAPGDGPGGIEADEVAKMKLHVRDRRGSDATPGGAQRPSDAASERSAGSPVPMSSESSSGSTPDDASEVRSEPPSEREAGATHEREIVVIDAYGLDADADADSQAEVDGDEDLFPEEDDDGRRKRWSLFRRGGNR
jgi:chromosome partitioning protein